MRVNSDFFPLCGAGVDDPKLLRVCCQTPVHLFINLREVQLASKPQNQIYFYLCAHAFQNYNELEAGDFV